MSSSRPSTPRATRRYDASSRQRKASEARLRVVDAARDLFVAHGFDGTTIEAIASAAEVSPQTVYAAFGSKRGVVAALLDRARFGEAYAELVEQAHATTDPVLRLQFAARIARKIYDAERRELEVLRGAGALSPELAEMEREKEHMRYESQRPLVEDLARAGKLRRGLQSIAARDALWALTGRDMYRMLVIERGWSSDRYERWLDRQIHSALLGPASGR